MVVKWIGGRRLNVRLDPETFRTIMPERNAVNCSGCRRTRWRSTPKVTWKASHLAYRDAGGLMVVVAPPWGAACRQPDAANRDIHLYGSARYLTCEPTP